ncbi:RNA exonuclease 1 homolog isoform X1 [Egretta garzetta]|uniref:RNA exonuclease 1 homolog isoform X1 n=1 Tax=Egretta garzetta TaxID=188379 RepID=UPI00163C95A5|nr:RNA exonuclease 1 homolog isoform X1 [Egretta garzetta]
MSDCLRTACPSSPGWRLQEDSSVLIPFFVPPGTPAHVAMRCQGRLSNLRDELLCHHNPSGGAWVLGAGGDVFSSPERGYDPYNPELPRPSLEAEDGALADITDVTPGILELELVNKAIEAVKNEVEREQKKYEELLETTKEFSASEASSLISNTPVSAAGTQNDSFTSLEYHPGSYNFNNNSDYNPTPLAAASRSSKYTLDTSRSKGSSLEYVPKAVVQNKKYSSTVTNNKYVIDDSKPSTDLEYDPLSNYSARLLSKATTKEPKGSKRGRVSSYEESYSPSRKKLCEVPDDYEVYARFSSSEDEADVEYKQTSVSSQSKAGSESESNDGLPNKEQSTKLDGFASQDSKEAAGQYGMEDLPSSQKSLAKNLADKNAKGAKLCSGKNDQEIENKNKDSKDKTKRKKSDGSKTPGLSEVGKKEKSKNTEKDKVLKKEEKLKTKSEEKNCKDKSVKVKTDGNLKKPEKQKSEKLDGLKKEKSKSPSSSSGKNKSEGVTKGSGTEKLGSSKKDSKLKTADVKNGKETCDRKTKEKGTKTPALERKKEKVSSTEKGDPKKGRKQQSLSHVDLFGDESGDDDDKGRPLPSTLLDVSSDSDGDDCGSDSESENEGTTKKVKRSKLSKSSSSSSTSDDIDYSILEKDLDFESDPMEECLRIFNESTDVKTEDKGRLGKQLSKEEGNEEKTEDNLTTLFPGQKRRISHLVKQGNAEVPSKPVIRPYRPPTAQEVCYQRIQLAQQQAAQLAVAVQKASLSLPGEKKRIAHVPNVALSAAAKQSLASSKTTVAGRSVTPSNDSEAPTLSLKACTLAGMASKTTSTIVPKRIAHVPSLQSTSLQRPVIPTEFGAKVPTNIRQRYLNLFIDECLKFCSSSQEAFDKALSEEKVAYERSTSRNIYLNVAVNTLKKLRSLVPNSPSSTNKTSNKKVVSHEAVLGGKLAAKTSFTLNRSGSLRAEDLTGPALYRRLKEYLMTEEQLKENGYPMPHPEKPGRAVLFTAEEKKTIDSSCRICCRCGTEYMVSASGTCIRKEECVHHWGRLRKQRVPGGWETHYSCCSGAVGSPGCQVAKQHVHDGRKESLDGFVKTFEKLPTTDGYPGIYALDCEMCYTKQGLELTRVTVINSDLKVVYDTFVKPDTKVVDYNTRFSGVTEEDLENTSITLRDVQAVLLNMFSADTILIGHSLESDLFALKLIHGTVVDTAIVFPHRLGLPYKRALRTLMADYLKRIIQDNVEGHDSSEDARACMELMVWKIKEDAKVKR